MNRLVQMKKIVWLWCIFGITSLFAMENKPQSNMANHMAEGKLVLYQEGLTLKDRKFADEVEHHRNKKYNINKFPLYSNKKQHLVIIGGTANCGKSSLCKALNTLDRSYIIISQDDIHRKVTYEICDNIFPAEMATVRKAIKYENMWRAIRCFDVLCTEETNEQEMECVIGAIRHIRNYFDDPAQEKQMIAMRTRLKHSIMEQMLFYAACGRNIIFDSWGVASWGYELEQLKICFNHTIGVVAYCSLATVLNRWNKRNNNAIETKNLNDRRMLCQSLKSFFDFFEPAKIDHNSSLIVTKKEFDLLMHNATQYIPDLNAKESAKGSFSHHEFTMEELLAFKEQTYIKIGFNYVDQVSLVPSVSHDILLCTEGDCDNYAHELLKRIKEKQTF